MLALDHAAQYLGYARDATARLRGVPHGEDAELMRMAATWTALAEAALDQAALDGGLAPQTRRAPRPAEVRA